MIFAILSFFSAVFLPGGIIFGVLERAKKIRFFSVAFFIVFSFVISLCVNFVLIYALVTAKLYTQFVVLGIFALEILVFLYLFWRRIYANINPNEILQKGTRFEKILFAISILIALYFLNKVLKADIFWAWDAVVSWDRWGSEWARGRFILNEGGYSQLYPMLLSLGYVASSQISTFQGVGVAIYWYFMFVGAVASLFILKDGEIFGANFLNTNCFGIALCVMIYMTFFRWSGEFYVGYVDMPVAMMILISALLLIKANALLKNADSANLAQNAESSANSVIDSANHINFAESSAFLLLGSFAAGISAEIKQSGLFWCGIYVLLLIVFFRKIGKNIILNIFIIIAFLAPWVIIALYKKIILNTPATNIEYTWHRIYLGNGYFERFDEAISRYKKFAQLFCLCILALGIKNRIFGFLGVASIVYFVFWGTHLSYDLRNLQGGLPLMMIAISAIMIYYFEVILRILPFLYKKVGAIFVIFVVGGLIVAHFSEERVIKGEYKRKMKIGGEATNALVLNAFKNNGAKLLLTNNQLIAYVPAFERKYYKHYSFGEHLKDGQFEAFAADLRAKEGSFYILLPKSEFRRYSAFLSDAKYLGESDYYALVEY
ncbi:hypothetical protein ACWIUD_05895 [Helicobacter sp. 23-1044]